MSGIGGGRPGGWTPRSDTNYRSVLREYYVKFKLSQDDMLVYVYRTDNDENIGWLLFERKENGEVWSILLNSSGMKGFNLDYIHKQISPKILEREYQNMIANRYLLEDEV